MKDFPLLQLPSVSLWLLVMTVVLKLLLCVVVMEATAAAQDVNAVCRLCPINCQSVPRADGSCPVCVCNGVALPECPPVPAQCSVGCQLERGVDGCVKCSCPQGTTVCAMLEQCPENCQQLTGISGCPECVCNVPAPFCPPIECPADCTLFHEEGSCPSCRCDPPFICPAVPQCLRGCINRDLKTKCFFCNCTLAPTQETWKDSDGVGNITTPHQGSKNPDVAVGHHSSILPTGNSTHDTRKPITRCRHQRLKCQAGCLIGIGPHGCRECYCGANAKICPHVKQCENRCQFMSPKDGCSRCKCSKMHTLPHVPLQLNRYYAPPSITPFSPFPPPTHQFGVSPIFQPPYLFQ